MKNWCKRSLCETILLTKTFILLAILALKIGIYLNSNFFPDIVRCTNDPAPCDTNATCENTTDSFACTCNAGLTGSGVTCDGERPIVPALPADTL